MARSKWGSAAAFLPPGPVMAEPAFAPSSMIRRGFAALIKIM